MGCRHKAPKGELVRVVRDTDGAVAPDATSRAAGRGAYVCSRECLDKSIKNGRLAAALRTGLSKDVYESIAAHPVWGGVAAAEDGEE